MFLRWFQCLCVQLCYVKFTRGLVIKAACELAKTVGGDESGALHCAYRQKDRQLYTDWKLAKSHFLKNTYQAVHGYVFPYFTGLPVSLSLYRLYSSRARFHNSV